MDNKRRLEKMQSLHYVFSPEKKSRRWTMHSTAGGRASEQLTNRAFSIDNHLREPGPAKCCAGSLRVRVPRCNYQSGESLMCINIIRSTGRGCRRTKPFATPSGPKGRSRSPSRHLFRRRQLRAESNRSHRFSVPQQRN